jgi:hypothetical protein
MTNDPLAAVPGRPPVVNLATWQAAHELLVREKAHTREGDADEPIGAVQSEAVRCGIGAVTSRCRARLPGLFS